MTTQDPGRVLDDHDGTLIAALTERVLDLPHPIDGNVFAQVHAAIAPDLFNDTTSAELQVIAVTWMAHAARQWRAAGLRPTEALTDGQIRDSKEASR